MLFTLPLHLFSFSSFRYSQVFRNYLTFCGLGLSNAQLFELSIQEYKKNQVKMRVVSNDSDSETRSCFSRHIIHPSCLTSFKCIQILLTSFWQHTFEKKNQIHGWKKGEWKKQDEDSSFACFQWLQTFCFSFSFRVSFLIFFFFLFFFSFFFTFIMRNIKIKRIKN